MYFNSKLDYIHYHGVEDKFSHIYSDTSWNTGLDYG